MGETKFVEEIASKYVSIILQKTQP